MEAVLEATTRDPFGKNEARRTRRDKRVPAVLYGATGDSKGPGGSDATANTVDVGFDSSRNVMRETEKPERDDAQSDARRAVEPFADPRLARLVEVWGMLSDAVRDEILGLADAACRLQIHGVR